MPGRQPDRGQQGHPRSHRPGPPFAPPRVSGLVFWLAAALLAATGLYHARAFCHDDAFITLRYVHRLVTGHGLTWNEGEHVEGFTHPLWLGQVALLHGFDLDPVAVVRALGLAYVAAIFLLWWRARVRLAPLLLVATQPGLLLWARSGLETASFCFWMMAGAYLALGASERARAGDARATRTAALTGAAFAAAALTRPEGFGAGLIALLWISRAKRPRVLLAAAALLVVPLAAYGLFRLAYFGDVLPNTARAKIGGLHLGTQLQLGWFYLASQWTSWLPGTAGAAIALALTGSARSMWIVALSLPVWISLFAGGGDYMPGARLVIPATVLAAFAVAISRRPGTRRSHVALIVLCAGAVWQAGTALTQLAERDAALTVGEPIGRYLEAHLPAGAVVATATAGSTPYYAPSLRFIDTLGLNDREIARRKIVSIETGGQSAPGHAKGDGAYVLRRTPDVIILGPAEGYLGQDPRTWFLTDFELLSSREFRERYRPYQFPVSVSPEEVAQPPLARMADTSRRFVPLTAYLRIGSVAAERLSSLGRPMVPPGSSPPR